MSLELWVKQKTAWMKAEIEKKESFGERPNFHKRAKADRDRIRRERQGATTVTEIEAEKKQPVHRSRSRSRRRGSLLGFAFILLTSSRGRSTNPYQSTGRMRRR